MSSIKSKSTSDSTSTPGDVGTEPSESARRADGRRRWLRVLGFCAVTGFVTGSFGFVSTCAGWMGLIPRDSVLAKASTVLIVILFPIGAMLAHSLDKIREYETAETAFKGARADHERD